MISKSKFMLLAKMVSPWFTFGPKTQTGVFSGDNLAPGASSRRLLLLTYAELTFADLELPGGKERGSRMLCRCQLPHVQLRGQRPTLKKAWTAVAQAYPRSFANLIAGAAASDVGWCKKLDIASCSCTGSLRPGEASNPGPRRSSGLRTFSLEEAPVQTWTSIHIGEKRWDLFVCWCRRHLSEDPLQLFLAVPLFLAHAVRRYGDLEFMNGGSLMYYRHLVLAAQRKVPTLKPYVSVCWDLASRWEKAEPVKHRPPIPEMMMQALVALSWSLGWRRWSSITLLCFYGVARVGEVLHCKRSDLLLPIDMMFESDSAFLLLRRSKSMYRQSARVQRLKIVSSYVVQLLTLVFHSAGRDEQLLHVPSALKVTPAG